MECVAACVVKSKGQLKRAMGMGKVNKKGRQDYIDGDVRGRSFKQR